MGERWDPAVRVRVQIVDSWLMLWRGQSRKEKHSLRVAWDRIQRRLRGYPHAHRWRAISGPLATVVVTLFDLGWDPARPAWWPAGHWAVLL